MRFDKRVQSRDLHLACGTDISITLKCFPVPCCKEAPRPFLVPGNH